MDFGVLVGFACLGLIVTGPLICVALFERPEQEHWLHPTNEQRWLGWAREGYLAGKLTVKEYEASVAHVLAGGGVDFDGRVVAAVRVHEEEKG